MKLTVRSGTDEVDLGVSAVSGRTAAELCHQLSDTLEQPVEQLFADGQPIAPSAPLGRHPLREGALLTTESPLGRRDCEAQSGWWVRVVGGPDAGATLALAPGRNVIGRGDDADVYVDDPAISRHHAVVIVDGQGATLRDVGSHNGTHTDAGELTPDEPKNLSDGDYVFLGSSALQFGCETDPPAAIKPDANGLVVLHRPPRGAPCPTPAAIAFPVAPVAPPRSGTPWIAALLPAVLAAGMAVLSRNLQFLLFAALTPVSLLGAAVTDRFSRGRGHRRERARFAVEEADAQRELSLQLAEERAERREHFADPAALLQSVTIPDCRVWERRRGDRDFLQLRLGLSDQDSLVSISDGNDPAASSVATAVPALLSLGLAGAGVVGPASLTAGVMRSLVGQLAALHSPMDVTLSLFVDAGSNELAANRSWRWVRWLGAHLASLSTERAQHAAHLAEVLALIEERRTATDSPTEWTGPWRVVVVDPAAALTGLGDLDTVFRLGPTVGVSALVVETDRRLLPSACHIVATASGAAELTIEDLRTGSTHAGISPACVSPAWAEALARALAPLREANMGAGRALPSSVTVRDLAPQALDDVDAVLAAWSRSDGSSTILGVGSAGPVTLDLVRDGPHALVAGTTGSGKSELLRGLVSSLAIRHPPTSMAFVLIDYKGGAAFAECADLPHTVAVITDLDAHLTRRVLVSLEAELKRREHRFAQAGVSDLAGYVAHAHANTAEPLPRLVIVVDEFAALADELPDFLDGLIGIAQRGRSLGVHLVLATQKPGGVVSPEIKANMALRIALRVTDPAESADVIGVGAAANINRRTPGRAFARVADGLIELQVAQLAQSSRTDEFGLVRLDEWNRAGSPTRSGSDRSELSELSDCVRQATRRSGIREPRQPWLPPLNRLIPIRTMSVAGAFGLADEPAQQRQVPLRFNPDCPETIGFIGSPRSGRTSSLRTLVAATASGHSPDELHVYVIDCAGGALAPLSQLAHCGSVCTADHPGSVASLLQRLDALVSSRRAQLADLGLDTAAAARTAGLPMPAVLLTVDGWEGFCEVSETCDGGRSIELLLRLMRDGIAAGLSVVVAGGRSMLGLRLSALLSSRYLLALTDPGDYQAAGLRLGEVPLHPGPGRAVEVGTGREVQLCVLSGTGAIADELAELARIAQPDAPRAIGLIAIRPLPRVVTRQAVERELEAAGAPAAQEQLLIGVGGDDAAPVTIGLLKSHNSLLVCGPPRSGRSNVAVLLAEQALKLGADVVALAPERSPLNRWARELGLQCLGPTSPQPLMPLSSAGLVVVDDTEAFSHHPFEEQLLQALEAGRAAVVVTARSDDLQVSYTGLAVALKRRRTGLLLQPGPGDGDILGVRIAHPGGLAPVGRGLLVTDEVAEHAPNGLPIQVAIR